MSEPTRCPSCGSLEIEEVTTSGDQTFGGVRKWKCTEWACRARLQMGVASVGQEGVTPKRNLRRNAMTDDHLEAIGRITPETPR